MKTHEMLAAHPSPRRSNLLAECIEACFRCAQTCTACADACLAEDNVAMLVRCIRTDLDCADMCEVTGRILSRQTETQESIALAQVQALAEACRLCAEECEQHADKHEHCRICAEACRRCEELCNRVAGVRA